MKRVREAYKRFRRRYLAQKEVFKQRIEYWKSKGMLEQYQRGVELLELADQHVEEINSMLPVQQTSRGKVAMRLKVKSFKEIYKELYESTKPVWRQWTEAILVAGLLAFFLRTYVFGLYHVPTGSAEPNILVGDRIWGNKYHYMFNELKRGDLVIFDRPNFVYDEANPVKHFWQKYIGFPLPIFGLDQVPDNWVKRVIALPGDTVEGRVVKGRTQLLVNGKVLDEPYVNSYPLLHVRKDTGFFYQDRLGPLELPGFMRKKSMLRMYTYDPSKALDEQNYYRIEPNEIMRQPGSGEYILEQPFTPSRNRLGQSYDTFGPHTVPAGKLWVQGDSRKNSEDSRYWGFLDQKLIHGRASFVIYSIDSEEPVWFFELLKKPLKFWTKHVRWNRFFKFLK